MEWLLAFVAGLLTGALFPRPEPRPQVLGTGTPVPEERELPSGDARIEALGVDYDYLP